MYHSIITGIGHYVPDNVVTNSDIEKLMDTTNEWIIERTGIKERRHVRKDSDDSPSTMGTKAAHVAIERAGSISVNRTSLSPGNAQAQNYTRHRRKFWGSSYGFGRPHRYSVQA